MDKKQKNKIENTIFWGVTLASAILFALGYDAAGMALFGILMLVYGVKSIKERNVMRAVLLLAVGALVLGVAIYERLN